MLKLAMMKALKNASTSATAKGASVNLFQLFVALFTEEVRDSTGTTPCEYFDHRKPQQNHQPPCAWKQHYWHVITRSGC